MLDAVRPAKLIELVRPARLVGRLGFFLHRKPIGKRAIIIRQDGVDRVRKRRQEGLDSLRHRGGGPTGQHLDPDIAGGTVNGHQDITGPLL